MFYARLIALILMLLLVFGLAIHNFANKTKEEQIEVVIHWLRSAVFEAEQSLGGGTGQLKLAYVYNLAIKQFPWIAELYPYERFDNELVKPALEWLNTQMSSNENIKKLLGL